MNTMRALPLGRTSFWHTPLLTVYAAGPFLLSGTGASVALDRCGPRFVGASSGLSIAAECSALLWALVWAIASLGTEDTAQRPNVQFLFDCTAAGGAAFEGWKHNSLAVVGPALAAVAAVAEVALNVTFKHVTAHSGHPWNEFADATCTALARRSILFPAKGSWQQSHTRLYAEPKQIEWARLVFMGPAERSQFPPAIPCTLR